MGNKPLNTSVLDRAILFAVKAHSGTERRGKGYPYIVHPLEAVEIVATMTKDQELLAAAVLHDTVEDTDVTVDQIRAEFGDRVAALVAAETDEIPGQAGNDVMTGLNGNDVMTGLKSNDVMAGADRPSEEETWHARKQAAIDRLAKASREAKIVALGDKLSNMRAIARDYAVLGDALWDLFHAKDPKDHEWHYRGLANALKELDGTFAYQEFVKLINQVFA